ncbi:MAG: hypothetical protein ACYCPT_13150 [Acidimicrobiales bacterium]
MPLTRIHFPVFTSWLKKQPSDVGATVWELLDYLCEFGRQAVLPDVLNGVQISAHYPDMSEVRLDRGSGQERRSIRVLTCFVDGDTAVLVCLGGDKHGYKERTGRDWYDDYVPLADQIVKQYYDRGGQP